jgi:hypothetical protein
MNKKQNKKIKFDPFNLKPLKVFLVVVFFVFIFSYGTVMFFIGEKIKNSDFKTNVPNILEAKISSMVSGHPIQRMTPYISKRNESVAAFLVAIAKKESNWGKESPQKDGKDCYNYWGYRGDYNQTNSGYSCFDNPEQAVSEVGGRIEDLINKKIDNPKKMVYAWKCGSDCSDQDPQSVRKWVSDVSFYYKKIYN